MTASGRRAKAKLLDGKLDQESMELAPDGPPELAAGWDTDLQLLIHEDDERELLFRTSFYSY